MGRFTCKKCESASGALYDLDLDEVAESLQDKSTFGVGGDGQPSTVNTEGLTKWLQEHRKHGEIAYEQSY